MFNKKLFMKSPLLIADIENAVAGLRQLLATESS